MVAPPEPPVAVVAKLPIMLATLDAGYTAAGLVVAAVDGVEDDAAPPDPPEAAWILQMSAETLWTSVGLVSLVAFGRLWIWIWVDCEGNVIGGGGIYMCIYIHISPTYSERQR